MNWLQEYKTSLKNIDAEEPLDVYFYRPIAFVIVKLFYSYPITPNQYSLMALIAGIISSYLLSLGTIWGFKFGAFFFLLFAVLDCCDGMVARMKKNGTEFGRLIDGVVDYTVNILVYVGLAIGVKKSFLIGPIEPWILVVLAGVSKAIHSITYDHYLTEYLAYEKGNSGFAQIELENLKSKYLKAVQEKSNVKAFALKLYIGYTSLQVGNKKKVLNFDPKEYCERNLTLLKRWSVIGPAVHILFLIIAFLFNTPNVLFFYAIVFGNAWMLLMFSIQFKTNTSMKIKKEVK